MDPNYKMSAKKSKMSEKNQNLKNLKKLVEMRMSGWTSHQNLIFLN